PKRLEVVEACSGIRSLMTLVTLAVVFAYFTHPRDEDGQGKSGSRLLGRVKSYGFWRSLILVLSAVPIAILTNALRVSGTGVLARFYGTRVADGFFHSFSGWVIYILAFLLLFAVGRALDYVGPRPGRKSKVKDEGRAGSERTDAAPAPADESPAIVNSSEGSVSA
ncbi:MAG TPA: archaeosortase/exosortase family protein, partial [Pyrinomonadaceae bacterium]